MGSHSRTFYRLLLVATAINVVGLPFAVLQSEPWHATVHAGLALACGFWALMLRHRRPVAGSQMESGYDIDETRSEAGQLDSGDQAGGQDQWLKRTSQPEHEERDQ